MADHTQVTFKTHHHFDNPDHVVAVVGSVHCLGSWDPAKSLILTEDQTTGAWKGTTRLSIGGKIDWKLVVLDRCSDRIVQWEDGGNRNITIGRLPIEVEAPWNGKEKVIYKESPAIGIDRFAPPSVGDIVIKSALAQSTTSNQSTVPVKVANVTFKIRFAAEAENQAVAVIGNEQSFGSWNPFKAFVCQPLGNDHCWSTDVSLEAGKTYEWKMVCLDKYTNNIIHWETGPNRRLYVTNDQMEVVAPWNIKEVVRYSRTPSVILTPLEKKGSDLDCRAPAVQSMNNNADDKLAKVVFVVDRDRDASETAMCIIGNCESLGDWNVEQALQLRAHETGSKWHGTIFVPQGTHIEWKLVKVEDETPVWETCDNRHIHVNNTSMEVFVSWNDNHDEVDLQPFALHDFVEVTFLTEYRLNPNEALVVVGSNYNLGDWNPVDGLPLDYEHKPNCWSGTEMFVIDDTFEWKLAVIDKETKSVIRWEERENRVLQIGKSSLQVITPWCKREALRELFTKTSEFAIANDNDVLPLCDQCRDYKVQYEDNHLINYNQSTQQTLSNDMVNVLFETNISLGNEDHAVAITGSCEELGNWDKKRALVLHKGETAGSWKTVQRLPHGTIIDWKLFVINKISKKAVLWEKRENRRMILKRSGISVNVLWNSKASGKATLNRLPSPSCLTCDKDIREFNVPSGCVETTISTNFCYHEKGYALAAIGTTAGLGNWQPQNAAVMRGLPDKDKWQTIVNLPINVDIRWKLVMMERDSQRIVQWEDDENRTMRFEQRDLHIIADWDQAFTATDVRLDGENIVETSADGSVLGRKKSVQFANDLIVECKVLGKSC